MRLKLAFLAGALLAGCSDSQVLEVRTPPLQASEMTVREIARSNVSAVADIRRVVVRDDATWTQIWADLHGLESAPPPLPVVDFSRETVVVATLGRRPNAGYDVAIGTVHEGAEGLTVEVHKEISGESCGTAQVITHPYAVAAITRTSEPVRFVETEAVRECTGRVP